MGDNWVGKGRAKRGITEEFWVKMVGDRWGREGPSEKSDGELSYCCGKDYEMLKYHIKKMARVKIGRMEKNVDRFD